MSRTALGLYTERIPRFRRYGSAREFVTLSLGFTGLVSNLGGGSAGYFQISASSFQPYNGTYNFVGLNNPGGAVSGGSFVNQGYPGYVALAQNYAGMRYHRAGLSVTCTPVLATDNLTLAIMPYTWSVPALTGFDAQVIAGQTQGKIIQCLGGQPNTIKKNLHMSDICGLTRMQWAAQLPSRTSGDPDVQYRTYWLVRWSTNDGGVLAGNVSFTMTVTTDMEFSNPTNQVT